MSYLKHNFVISPRRLEKATETAVRIIGVPVEIGNVYLQDKTTGRTIRRARL